MILVMPLSNQDIEEFIALWANEFGDALGREEAVIAARNFLELCLLIVQPLPGEPNYAPPPITF